MNKTKRNSGFSITETVIALAIILIVTMAALSVVMASISARVKAANYSEAQDFAHNMLECFKAAESNDEFESNVAFATGLDWSAADTNYIYDAENRFKADITADFTTDVTTDTFEITVTNNKGEEIISFSYTKGAKE